ncbi:MAG: hypothetical protein R2867_19735 [Caldilineaceae bacterium]
MMSNRYNNHNDSWFPAGPRTHDDAQWRIASGELVHVAKQSELGIRNQPVDIASQRRADKTTPTERHRLRNHGGAGAGRHCHGDRWP